MHRMATMPSTARTDSEGDNLGAPADIMDPSEVGKISRGDKTYGAKTAKPMSTKHGKKTQRNDQSKLMTAKKSMMDVVSLLDSVFESDHFPSPYFSI